MVYIEDGVNAPSHDVYAKIIEELKPPSRQRAVMDRLYATIRKTLPPNVCEIINSNQELFQTFADENKDFLLDYKPVEISKEVGLV